MLPKISSTIAQAIQPIASSRAHNDSSRYSSSGDPPASQPDKEQSHSEDEPCLPSPEAPSLRLVPKPPLTSQAGLLFLQLVDLIKRGKAPLTRWMGGRAYLASIKRQKLSGRFRKGTLLDHRAE